MNKFNTIPPELAPIGHPQNESRMILRPTALAVALICLGSFACVDLDTIGDFGSSVSGEVQGKSFVYGSGTAESDAAGNYFITLSDSSNYNCFSSPSGAYLSIVIAGIQQPGTFSAASAVTFNNLEGNVNHSDSAVSGTVTIEAIDDADRSIQGSISATGLDSDVQGSFSVAICD
ncbi:MAG: hypothetical protein H0U74_01760 [Bradymonadaceae bacterium]|nr:hypothetical protein [Lujinxingiaceae bacterium]